MVSQTEFSLRPRPRGCHLVTDEILAQLPPLPRAGLLHLFLQHTSAALTINENADPDVRSDMASVFDRLIRERALLRSHARRRRRHAGARQIDARRRIADDPDYGRPAESRSVAGHLPVRVPQSRRRTQDRRHGRWLTERISTCPVTIRINIGSTFSGKFVFFPIHNTLRFSKSFPVKGYGTSESAGLPSSRCGSTMCRTPLALSKAMISGPVKILRQTDFP